MLYRWGRPMSIKDIIAKNIRRYRLLSGFTQEEAAERAKLSRAAYISIEQAKAEPRVSTLDNIASALKVSIQSIIEPAPELKSLRFRSQKRLSGKEKIIREDVVNKFAFKLRDLRNLEEMLHCRKKFALAGLKENKKHFSHEDLKTLSVSVRSKLDICEEDPIPDLSSALESAGVIISAIDFKIADSFGFSLSEDDLGPAIGVNDSSNISVERKIFTIAHEFAHILLHSKSFNVEELGENEQEEKEANIFASYFLMPQKRFKRIWEESRGLDSIERIFYIKRIFKVSYKTILYRLIEERITDNNIWQTFNMEYKRKYNKDLKGHKEPCPLAEIDFSEDYLEGLIRDALSSEKISQSRAAEILGISLLDLREKTKSWQILH